MIETKRHDRLQRGPTGFPSPCFRINRLHRYHDEILSWYRMKPNTTYWRVFHQTWFLSFRSRVWMCLKPHNTSVISRPSCYVAGLWDVNYIRSPVAHVSTHFHTGNQPWTSRGNQYLSPFKPNGCENNNLIQRSHYLSTGGFKYPASHHKALQLID